MGVAGWLVVVVVMVACGDDISVVCGSDCGDGDGGWLHNVPAACWCVSVTAVMVTVVVEVAVVVMLVVAVLVVVVEGKH